MKVFSNHVFLDRGLIQFTLVFIFVSLLLKLAMAPFYWWSFNAYEGSPSNSGPFLSVAAKNYLKLQN